VPENVDVWVEEVLAGKRERYRAVVESFEAPVRLVLGAIVPDRQAVDDLVHEVFFAAYLKLGEYQRGTDFRSWIKAFARNVALNERRRWLKQRQLSSRYDVEIEEAATPLVDQFTALVDGETLAHVRGCVNQLGEAARRVVERYYFEGASGEEIARKEGRKESWVHLVLHRARVAIGHCLENKGVLGHG
jgi:RNA polymerase sigma-70 factor (ECF subfamily)